MKAIRVRYVGPTERRGARLIADDGDGCRVAIAYPHELDQEAGYRAAAWALCNRRGWAIEEYACGWHKGVAYFVNVGGGR